MILGLSTASGAPGATTLAVALTLAWPREVFLVEADISRPSAILSGYYRGGTAPWGLPALARLAQSGELTTDAVLAEGDQLAEGRKVIIGITTPAQAAGVSQYWGPILAALEAISSRGVDIIIDAGRMATSAAGQLPVAADAAALITGTSIPDLVAARAATPELRRRYTPGRGLAGLIVIRPGQPYTADDAAKFVRLPLLGQIPEDRDAAAHLSAGRHYPRYPHSRLHSSASATAERVRATIRQYRQHLGLPLDGEDSELSPVEA